MVNESENVCAAIILISLISNYAVSEIYGIL